MDKTGASVPVFVCSRFNSGCDFKLRQNSRNMTIAKALVGLENFLFKSNFDRYSEVLISLKFIEN